MTASDFSSGDRVVFKGRKASVGYGQTGTVLKTDDEDDIVGVEWDEEVAAYAGRTDAPTYWWVRAQDLDFESAEPNPFSDAKLPTSEDIFALFGGDGW